MRPAFGAGAPVLGLADQLVGQVDTFLQMYRPFVDDVPQGGRMLAESQQLRAAVVEFRQAARGGADLARLSRALGSVESQWRSLAGDIRRIVPQNRGPIVQAAMQVGNITQEIRQGLDGPGGPPAPPTGYRPTGIPFDPSSFVRPEVISNVPADHNHPHDH